MVINLIILCFNGKLFNMNFLNLPKYTCKKIIYQDNDMHTFPNFAGSDQNSAK